MGRPKLLDRKKSISVTLKASTFKVISMTNKGNISAGIDSICEHYQQMEGVIKQLEKKLERAEKRAAFFEDNFLPPVTDKMK